MPLLALAATLAVLGKTRDLRWLHVASKPVPLFILIGVVATSDLEPELRLPLLLALAMSLAGDVLLMFDHKGFVLGLASFLLAHLAYLVTLWREGPWHTVEIVYLAPPAITAMLVTRRLWPHLGALRGPVLAYAVALALVAWRLLARGEPLSRLSGAVATVSVLGAVLFVLGDVLLALRRFRGLSVPYAVELGSYFAAQALIVLSFIDQAISPGRP
jgi:uncharacterized membrane protein YhhN